MRALRERSVEVCHVQFFSRGLGYLGRVHWPAGVSLVLTHQGAGHRGVALLAGVGHSVWHRGSCL